MPDLLTKLAYQSLQQGKSSFGVLHKTLSTQFMNLMSPPPPERQVTTVPPEVLQKLQRENERLRDVDWQEAEQGIYPASLLFDEPWEDFLRFYPLVWLDLPQIWQRIQKRQYQKFSSDVETRGYPAYYVQNFHHQTDGYLSEFSANLYDIQVELLFHGTADAMRRRILAPLKNGLAVFSDVPAHQLKVLDVACGTGRTLKSIRAMLPKASLHGTDLSPAYLRKANELLSQDAGTLPQLLQSNAEAMPYTDDYFHAVVSVFLFHELPPDARQNVINECFRVTKPGGTFIICDSIQMSDSPDLEVLMQNFDTIMHEPYYRSYIHDDMVSRLQKAGFTAIQEQVYQTSKYWITQKPV
jgi:ubiquinone/menaquinone biosynthesis C-methylase UbiE